MPIYDLKCKACNINYEEFKSYEDRFLPGKCEMCGGQTERAFNNAPSQMNIALPDGFKRKGFSDLKEAAKLESEAMDSRADERKRLTDEVKRLRVVK